MNAQAHTDTSLATCSVEMLTIIMSMWTRNKDSHATYLACNDHNRQQCMYLTSTMCAGKSPRRLQTQMLQRYTVCQLALAGLLHTMVRRPAWHSTHRKLLSVSLVTNSLLCSCCLIGLKLRSLELHNQLDCSPELLKRSCYKGRCRSTLRARFLSKQAHSCSNGFSGCNADGFGCKHKFDFTGNDC